MSQCDNAVKTIKTAILQSQADAVRATNKRLLALYFGVGKYLSINSRTGTWGTGAINAISERLDRELPGLRGFSPRNLRNMRVFYEEWSFLDKLTLPATSNGKSNLADASAKLQDDASAPKTRTIPISQPRAPTSLFGAQPRTVDVERDFGYNKKVVRKGRPREA